MESRGAMVNRRQYYRSDGLRDGILRIRVEGTLSSPGECDVLNFSAGGCSLIAPYKLPVGRDDVRIIIEFKIVQQHTVEAELMWTNKVKNRFRYGCKWVVDEASRNQILKEIQEVDVKALVR